jgi:PAS domain-containing protein
METTYERRPRLQPGAAQFLLGIAGLALITFVCFRVEFGVARTGFAYLILIALVSLLGSLTASIVLSIVGAACLNYFFAPPLFEFRIDALDDVVWIAAFLTTSLIASALTTKLKRSEQELGKRKVRLEEAQRIAHVGWWERDLFTGRVALSDEASRIFGVQPADLPEWHGRWLALIHPEDRQRVADAAAGALHRANSPQPGRRDVGQIGTASAPVWRSARHHEAETGGAGAACERGALPHLGGPCIRCVLSLQ